MKQSKLFRNYRVVALGRFCVCLCALALNVCAHGQTLRNPASTEPPDFAPPIERETKKFTLTSLSAQDQRWLATLPPLRAGVYRALSSDRQSSDELHSLSDAYLDYFERALRLHFKRIPVESAVQAISMLRAGTLDLAASAIFDDRSDLFDFTVDYASDPLMIVVRQDALPLERKSDLAERRVAVIDDAAAQALENDVPAIRIVRAPSTYQGMYRVAHKSADAFVGNLASIDLNIRKIFGDTLSISGSTSLKQRLAFAIAKPYCRLAPILNQALEALPKKERQRIRNRWLAAHHNVNWSSVLSKLAPVALVLFAVIAALLYGYLRLRVEMRRRRRAERAKDAFLAMMSHEIRTPMNSVLGLVELLRHRQADAEQRQMLDMVHESAAALLQILDDILDFSKIEAEQLLIERRPFDLRALCDSVAGLLAGQARAKGLELRVAVAKNVAARIVGDRVRVRQILVNLLSNAIKFTESGQVCLSIAAAAGARPASQKLIFQVSDTGVGIAPDALKSLFKPFVQAGPSISRRYGGTGLGLSICQRLVKLMGGEISIESAPSRGTTVRFSVEFPMYLQPPDESANPASPLCVEAHDREQMPHPHRPPASAPRILVAEDHPVNRLLLRQQLTQLGYTCDTVENGAQALDALAQHSYALLITDCQMPEMDGYQLAEHIRANEKAIHAAQSLPILAITANTLRSEQARCLKAGINDYLLKPVQLDTLAQRIRQWIAPSGAHREPDAQDDKDLEHFSASSYGERIAAQGKPLKNALDTLIQSLKPLYRDHPAQLRALLLTLAESLRADLVRLHEQLNAPPPLDRARLRQWIHRQSGAFAIFGHTPFTAQFDTLRASAQHAPDDALRTEARALARALELFAQRLELELEHFSMRIFDHELHA